MDFETISRSPLFEGLPRPHLERLNEIAIEKKFNAGESIFIEGDVARGFYLISNGRVKIFKVSPEGKEKILHILGNTEPFGEVAVFSGLDFPANAVSLTPSSLLFFPRDAFVKLITDNPALSLNMLALLSNRLKKFTVQIEGLTLKDVPGRLAEYLLDLSRSQEDQKQVTLNVSKGQLASLLGTIPETLSRILSKMSHCGLIEVKGKEIRILDIDGLEKLGIAGRFTDE